jgi:ABC-type polysaccharide/polyol phosphate transport system ATPase subunit
MNPLAQLSDVGKRYVKYEDVPTLVTGVRQLLKRGRRGRLWAVRHVDLDVEEGQAIGILGRNGSGKSTTLSMMAGVTAPTEGRVRVNGRIAPLLRLGVGFDPELTGRENVYVNGMILGMTPKHIEQKFDEIVAFAELENFINTPVKFYSSGMIVRLGFASAVAADPNLLIIDEVLAVGDVAFQVKSFDRMIEMRENGATLVVVSHNIQAIRRITDQAIVLHDGEVKFHGNTGDAISTYHDLLRTSLRATDMGKEYVASDVMTVLSHELLDDNGLTTANVESGQTVTFDFRIRLDKTIENGVYALQILTETGQVAYAEHTDVKTAATFNAGEIRSFRATLPMRLASGSFVANSGIRWGAQLEQQAMGPPIPFYVSGRRLVRGVADLEATFDTDAVPSAGTGSPADGAAEPLRDPASAERSEGP